MQTLEETVGHIKALLPLMLLVRFLLLPHQMLEQIILPRLNLAKCKVCDTVNA